MLTEDFKSPSNHPIINSHGKSVAGGDKPAEKSQDRMTEGTSETVRFVVVADGHGADGGIVAEECIKTITEWTRQNSDQIPTWTQQKMVQKVEELFKKCHDNTRVELVAAEPGRYSDESGVVRHTNRKHVSGGSTLSCVWIFRREGKLVIHSANVGDSDIILFTHLDNKVINLTHLSTDHSPLNQDEYERIMGYPQPLRLVYDCKHKGNPPIYQQLSSERKGSVVDDLRVQTFVLNPWGNGLSTGNVRYTPSVYAMSPRESSDESAVAMTRCIGDFQGHPFGLSWVPSQEQKVLDQDDGASYALFVGSDGIWDCYKYEDFARKCVSYLNESDSIVECVDRLVTETVVFSKVTFGKNYDDITLVGVII